jgi:predicted RNA-binding protein with PIN domain
MFLIDGYNLLHVVTRGRVGDEERRRLIRRVEEFCRRGGYRARIVFDPTGGTRRRETRGNVAVHYVSPGSTADGEILAALAATKDRTAYTVVTNDRGIAREAEGRKIKVMSCEDFARAVPAEAPAKEPGELSRGEVDDWMREFGIEDP